MTNDQIAALRAFAREVLSDFPESFPDGLDLQELAIKHGLLIGTEVKERCQPEGCHCADYHGESIADGVTCYRRAPMLKGAGS